MKNNPNQKDSADAHSADKKSINANEIGKIRHDEPVTAKGVLRALFMANEPEQRMEINHSESKDDEKSS